nr:hypothetical protein [Tanacetum cinerariifolium]
MKNILKDNDRLLTQALSVDIVNITVYDHVNSAGMNMNACDRCVTFESELQKDFIKKECYDTLFQKFNTLEKHSEAIQADCDVKATNIVLQGLPPKVYALVSTHKEKVLVITALKESLSKFKGKDVVNEAVPLHSIDPELLKIDVAPLSPKLRKNRTTHTDYIRHTLEEAATLREIVESERLINPLNTSLDHACKYTKRIQELLIIIQQTCPCITDLGTKLVAVTPKNNHKQIRLTEHIPKSGKITIKTTPSTDVVSNTHVLSSTGVNLLSSASGSKSQDNIKNNRIQRTPRKDKKNKLEDHLRIVRPVLNKKNVQAPSTSEQSTILTQSDTEIKSDSNIISYSQYMNKSQYNTIQNSSVPALQDDLILSVIEQLKTQAVNCTKINQDNKQVNEILTAKLERYKNQERILKEQKNDDKASALGFQNLCYLKRAQQLKPKLYDGSVIEKSDAIVIHDSEETLLLAEEMQPEEPNLSASTTIVEVPMELPKVSLVNSSLKKLKFHLASFDMELFNLFDQLLIDELIEVQQVFKQMEQAVEQHCVETTKFQDKMKNILEDNDRLLTQAISVDIVNIVVYDHVNSACMNMNACDRCVTIESKLQKDFIKKDCYDTLFQKLNTLEKHSLKESLSKLKGKDVVNEAVPLHSINPELLKINVAPLAPKLHKNRTAHTDYIRHTIEEAATLREIAESERLINPLNTSLEYACKYTKRIQELLIILQQTCPCITNLGTKLVAVTPKNKNKQIRFTEQIPKSGKTAGKTTHSTNSQVNTKNDRIQRTPRKAKKNNLEDHPRTVRPTLNKKNVVDTKATSSVKYSMSNVNSDLKCASSVNGKKYILMIVDDYSRFTWAKFLRSKYDTSDFIIKFLRKIQVRLKVLVHQAVATTCFTQNRSIIRLRHGKAPYELLHNKLPDLSFFHVFGALCYPKNDSKNLGKRTRRIVETIHVDFDELTAMASEQSSSGPALNEITPGTISSGLVQKSSPSTSYVPPSRNDWDLLFQPMFDELLNPPPSVDHQVAEVIAPIADVIPPVQADLAGSPSSTTVDQDAPSPSKSHTTTEIQSSVIPQDVEEDNLDMEVAHIR